MTDHAERETEPERVEREVIEEMHRDIAFHSPPNKTAAQFAYDMWMHRQSVAEIRSIVEAAPIGPIAIDSSALYTLLGQIRRERVWAYRLALASARERVEALLGSAPPFVEQTEPDGRVYSVCSLCEMDKYDCLCATSSNAHNTAINAAARAITEAT